MTFFNSSNNKGVETACMGFYLFQSSHIYLSIYIAHHDLWFCSWVFPATWNFMGVVLRCLGLLLLHDVPMHVDILGIVTVVMDVVDVAVAEVMDVEGVVVVVVDVVV